VHLSRILNNLRAWFTDVGAQVSENVEALISNNKFSLWHFCFLLFLTVTENTNGLFVILEKKKSQKTCGFYFSFVEAPERPPRPLTLKSGSVLSRLHCAWNSWLYTSWCTLGGLWTLSLVVFLVLCVASFLNPSVVTPFTARKSLAWVRMWLTIYVGGSCSQCSSERECFCLTDPLLSYCTFNIVFTEISAMNCHIQISF
jgi:hypothetical protein